MNNLSSKLLSDMIFCLYFLSLFSLRTPRYYRQELARTQTFLYWKNNGREGEERNLVSFFIPWSLVLRTRHQSLAFRARQAKRLRRRLGQELNPRPKLQRNVWKYLPRNYGHFTWSQCSICYCFTLVTTDTLDVFFKNDIFCCLCGNVLSLLDLCTNYSLIFTIV